MTRIFTAMTAAMALMIWPSATRRLHALPIVALAVALIACNAQIGGPSPIEPAPTDTPDPTPSPRPTSTPTATPSPEATPSPTATPFGARVFDDPDDCEHSSGVYRVAFPDDWWWNTEYQHPELGTIDACQYFSPDGFDITTASREQPVPDGIAVYANYVEGGCVGFLNPVLDERETTVDGHPATVREFARGKQEDNPPGRYQYMVDLAPDVDCEAGGRFIVATTGVDMVGDYDENKAMLDRMMETMEIREP